MFFCYFDMPCLSEGFDKRAHASFRESDDGYFFLVDISKNCMTMTPTEKWIGQSHSIFLSCWMN